ncbi:hypothetical protein [Streptomyces sp. NPDC048172]|uniref:LppU/SCO3897 family protein n=1 Tax=Streptomyces sp. NPDC048172 TaxID=3365505 RepID=UPI00371A198E
MKKLLEMWRGRGGQGGQGDPEEPGDQAEFDGPEERARRGRWRLVVAGALFATLILPKVISSASYTDPALAQPSPSGSASTVPAYPSSGPTRGPTVSPSLPSLPTTAPSSSPSSDSGSGMPSPPTNAAPSPTRTGGASGEDSAAAAFRGVRAGQCLTVHSTGKGWSREAPTKGARVGCGSERAYVRVTAVRDDRASCPDGNGRGAWASSDRGGGRTVALCLTRQFRVDECLLAEGGGGEMRAALMSAPACGGKPSKPYDRVLRITSIHAKDGGAPKGLCTRGDGDRERYWTWRVDGGRYTLCAREA